MKRILLFFVQFIERIVMLGARDAPWLPMEDYPELQKLEKGYQVMRREYLHACSTMDAPYMDELSAAQARIVKPRSWQAIFLKIYGESVDKNRLLFPETFSMIDSVPGIRTAFFSVFQPHTRLLPHRGPYKGVLRYHLGLIIPDDSGKCALRIGEETYHWTAGASVLFDDTYIHEAWNDSDQVRVVLFVDIERDLHLPFRLLNRFFLFCIRYTPFTREIYSKANH